MDRKHVIAVGLAALALPALAAAQGYPPPAPQGSPWGDQAAPPPPDQEYPTAPGDVDVSVDLASPGAGVTFDTFRDGLAPYGEWVEVRPYGRVWRPARVAAGWRPYYYGRWEWTDEGWLWVSDEPWGWAAYHYGRWAYDGAAGWVWIPGYQWAPAWVTWRYSPDYVGWAPLGPGFSVYVSSYPAVYGWWTFVPCRRFVGVPVYSVAYGGGHVRGLFHQTLPAPPRATVYGAPAPAWGGPARPFMERHVGHAIAPVRVQPVPSPAGLHASARAGVVPIYRPELRPTDVHRPAPAPRPAPALAAPAAAPRPVPQGQPVHATPSLAPPRYAPAPLPQHAPAPSPPQQRYVPAPQARPAPAPQAQQRYAAPPQAQPPHAPAPAPVQRQAPAPAPAPAPAQRQAPAPAPSRVHGGGGAPQGVAPRAQNGAALAYRPQRL